MVSMGSRDAEEARTRSCGFVTYYVTNRIVDLRGEGDGVVGDRSLSSEIVGRCSVVLLAGGRLVGVVWLLAACRVTISGGGRLVGAWLGDSRQSRHSAGLQTVCFLMACDGAGGAPC